VDNSLRDLRICVTGAGGFLGPVVVDTLARQGASVQAIIGPPGEDARVPRGAASIARADIIDTSALRKLVAGADLIVHLAGPASVAASFQDPQRTIRIHSEGTAALLEACKAEKVTRLIYVSSAEVYGQPLRNPVGEDHPLSARSPYGAAKIGAEKLIESYVHAFELRAVILRPFSIYGPGASPQSLIPRIIGLARQGLPVVLRDLKPIRDYCFVTDLAEAVARACLFEAGGLEIFNVATMRGASVEEVARLILQTLGLSCPIQGNAEHDRPGKSEIYELIGDNRRARELLGWQPAIALEEGLRRTAAGIER
jgi:nucleoside-diphosphate-sugar epimerase